MTRQQLFSFLHSASRTGQTSVSQNSSWLDIQRVSLLPANQRSEQGQASDWASANLQDDFEDVIWTDECSVQLEPHRRTCCRKIGEAPRPKPRYIIIKIPSSPCTFVSVHYIQRKINRENYLCLPIQTQTSNEGACLGWDQLERKNRNLHLRGNNECTTIYVYP